MVFVGYPRCSTSNKAQKWMDEHAMDYEFRHIKENNPSKEELKEWRRKSGLPLKKFFNTSGILYRQMELKDQLPGMTDEEKFELLATDGLLVKRPILVADDFVLVGFKQADWEEKLK